MGIVWHGHYLEYMGEARSALLRSCRLDAPDLQALGYLVFITEARCRYLYPLRYGDRARVTAWFVAARPLVRIAYVVDNLTQGRRSARAHTSFAVTDSQAQLLKETPDDLLDRLPIAL